MDFTPMIEKGQIGADWHPDIRARFVAAAREISAERDKVLAMNLFLVVPQGPVTLAVVGAETQPTRRRAAMLERNLCFIS